MNETKITVKEVSLQWLNMKRLVVKPSTYARYYSITRKHILPELGDLTLEQINSSVINSFTCRKLGDTISKGTCTGSMSAKTVRDICTVLKSILHYGEKEYQLNSLAENTVLPKAVHTSKETLAARELKKLETYLWENQETLRCAGLLICLYTGIRLGEICALKWEDIDLKHHVLCIHHTTQRISVPEPRSMERGCRTAVIIDAPKSDASIRMIPIPSALYPLIRALSPGTRPENFFLTNSLRLAEPRNYQYFFQKTLEQAGVRKVNFHMLRHTFASRCVETGMDVKTLSEILGHANINITLNYYVHSSLETKRKQLNRLKF